MYIICINKNLFSKTAPKISQYSVILDKSFLILAVSCLFEFNPKFPSDAERYLSQQSFFNKDYFF